MDDAALRAQVLARFPDLPAMVSVDIETAGPVPSRYAMLSIGACLVARPEEGFYAELQPERPDADPQALAISRLSMDALAREGLPAGEALRRFDAWLREHVPGQRPVFVAFNAPFDWTFLNDAFHRHLGHNPFGHFALDIKAFYMGMSAAPLAQTSFRAISAQHLDNRALTHNALADARDQAAAFLRLLEERARRQP